ncbi:MAG: S8 family serine peptidase [Muribaculaceae bacterium]|nr:S8 family serine peptidase [Muribaculaceae bacterium]
MISTTIKGSVIHTCYKNEAGEEITPTSYIYVELKSESDYNTLKTIAQNIGCRIIKQNKFMPLWYTLCTSLTIDKDPVEIANQIMETKLFTCACPAFEIKPLISYDPLVLNQWGLYNPEYEDIDVSASEAWNYATGWGITVAVIDTGIELTHEDLYDNLSPNSYDTSSSSSPSVVSDNGTSSHGTHCAGIIGASRNNNKGIAGIAPDVSLMSISVDFSSPDIEAQLADGINWACENYADILSCSWGGYIKSPIIEQAIDNALENGRCGMGCLIVCGAGNGWVGPPVIFPANYNEDVFAVGNIDRNGIWNLSSANGEELFISAPGTDILSTMVDNSYGEMSGTSMACPYVSGVVALMLELNPELSISEVHEIIARSAKKIGHLPYSTNKKYGSWNECYGYGLIDACEAVKNTPVKYY